MDLSFTEEQLMLQDVARRIAQDVIAPSAEHYDRSGEFPWENVKAMSKPSTPNTAPSIAPLPALASGSRRTWRTPMCRPATIIPKVPKTMLTIVTVPIAVMLMFVLCSRSDHEQDRPKPKGRSSWPGNCS